MLPLFGRAVVHDHKIARRRPMDLALELVLIPVADVDRAKAFYLERAGFGLLVDHRAGDSFRGRPPGSTCR
jgi:hypothetical protein